jgi:hypothetical protein
MLATKKRVTKRLGDSGVTTSANTRSSPISFAVPPPVLNVNEILFEVVIGVNAKLKFFHAEASVLELPAGN